MKKILLSFAIASLLMIACKKQTIEPEPVNNVQQVTSCGPFNACFSGTFQYDSLLTAQYVQNNPNVNDTVVSNFYYTLYADRDTVMQGKEFAHYITDSLTHTYNFLLDYYIVFNNPWGQKGMEFGPVTLLITKTNKMFIVKRTSYMY